MSEVELTEDYDPQKDWFNQIELERDKHKQALVKLLKRRVSEVNDVLRWMESLDMIYDGYVIIQKLASLKDQVVKQVGIDEEGRVTKEPQPL